MLTHAFACKAKIFEAVLLFQSTQHSSGKIINCTFPLVRCVPNPERHDSRLRPGIIIRMSLVDTRSSPDNIIDHYHKLVDCGASATYDGTVGVELPMDSGGYASFGKLGIFKGLDIERVSIMSERTMARAKERGDVVDAHRRSQIKTMAEHQSKSVF